MIDKPLAYRMRPQKVEDVLGQEKIKAFLSRLLESRSLVSMIFYGPPGTGKTTLAQAFARSFDAYSVKLNAVLNNKSQMEQAFQEAIRFQPAIVIIDEIHRLDKGKQDLLLPHLEEGDFFLIGCTTANPLISLNPAIRSRTRLLEATSLTKEDVLEGLRRAVKGKEGLDSRRTFQDEGLAYLAAISGGDLRFAYNQLEAVALSYPKEHVITLEDPVERRMAGINQVQMNNRAGMTFAAALRSVLRSDPDIVMVGEIRDGETAKIAVEAALTGHMVLSTLHTNDAAGAVTRLEEMGVEPFLTASSLVGVLAQRLVRKLCPKCKEEYTLTREEMLKILPDFPVDEYPQETYKIYKPKGCLTCNNTGYKGREAVFEFLTVTEEMKKLILDRANGAQIKKLAIEQGMFTLKNEGIYKVMEGKTSIEELLRVIV